MRSAKTTSAGILCAVLCGILAAVVITMRHEPTGMALIVEDFMPHSGVDHPVTAVLLNFRSYDTWLELGVLLLGWIGVLAVRGSSSLADSPMNPSPGILLQWFIRIVVPMALVIAGYLLWLGKFAAGGAFQAGVVAGAAGVLIWLAGYRSVAGLPPLLLKGAVLAGFVAFAALATGTLILSGTMLEYPPDHAELLILLIESLATISIGITVTALLIGIQPSRLPASPISDSPDLP